jgi:hypothetical protein
LLYSCKYRSFWRLNSEALSTLLFSLKHGMFISSQSMFSLTIYVLQARYAMSRSKHTKLVRRQVRDAHGRFSSHTSSPPSSGCSSSIEMWITPAEKSEQIWITLSDDECPHMFMVIPYVMFLDSAQFNY